MAVITINALCYVVGLNYNKMCFPGSEHFHPATFVCVQIMFVYKAHTHTQASIYILYHIANIKN